MALYEGIFFLLESSPILEENKLRKSVLLLHFPQRRPQQPLLVAVVNSHLVAVIVVWTPSLQRNNGSRCSINVVVFVGARKNNDAMNNRYHTIG